MQACCTIQQNDAIYRSPNHVKPEVVRRRPARPTDCRLKLATRVTPTRSPGAS